MKKSFLSLIFILIATITLAQEQQEENAFQQSENQATGTRSSGSAMGAVGSNQEQGPGNPPGEDEIPIDDYLPLLVLVGSSLIVYKYRYKIKQN